MSINSKITGPVWDLAKLEKIRFYQLGPSLVWSSNVMTKNNNITGPVWGLVNPD